MGGHKETISFPFFLIHNSSELKNCTIFFFCTISVTTLDKLDLCISNQKVVGNVKDDINTFHSGKYIKYSSDAKNA